MTDNSIIERPEEDRAASIKNVLKSFGSLKLTVVCLVLLAVLTVWGTVYQAENGLYQAQVKFFFSWVFFIFGFIPFPGTVLVMFVLFINLVFSLIYRIKFRLSNVGNMITHMGIIILLVGGGLTFYFSEESSLMLREGEISNMSTSRHVFELAVWEYKGGEKEIYAVDTNDFSSGKTLSFSDLGLRLAVSEYYTNCSALTSGDSTAVVNGSGIKSLSPRGRALEVAENTAGIMLAVEPQSGGNAATVLLYGQESNPTTLTMNSRNYGFILRKKKIQLPLEIQLKDFRIKWYPNSQIPKSYESTVKMTAVDGVERDVVISMNKPLRYADLTFFQSSYYLAPDKTEYSIFAVVKNTGRLLPYISSITIFTGMLIHFLMMMWRRRKNSGTVEKADAAVVASAQPNTGN